ncbi:MAG: hypothetical protein Q7R41_17165 [Phycisphaerales bacterium]|nr:hypothetical protein [Phycisphaerales bacterium]
MAKQLVNPIERHVEKAVLGIAGLLLVGVVVKYVFTSPNKIPLGQEPVTPSAIDARLAQKANDVLERIRSARPQEVQQDPLYDDFLAALAPLKGDALSLAVALGPPVPLIDSPEAVAGRATLVKVQRPDKPAYSFGRNTILVKDAQGNIIRQPTDWVTISALLDVKTQSDLQRKTWGATKSDVIYAPPELQRHMRRPDGSWSDEDWQMVKCSPAINLPPPPPIRLLDDGGKMVTSKDDQRAFEKYDTDLLDPVVQLNTLRPHAPEVVSDGNPWRFPIITSYEDVLKQDDEYLHPKDAPLASPDDRYGLKSVEPSKAVKTPKGPADAVAQELDNAKKLLEEARKSRSRNDATTAFNQAQSIKGNLQAPADVREKAERLMKEADLLIQDIAHGAAPPVPVGKLPGAQAEAKPTRVKLANQQVWAHDWAVGSIINGESYQYRIRIRVLNRLAAYPESFEDPQNGGVVFIAGEWSEPTDPIKVPDASLFFVTRDDPKRREISVEFFRWFDGVWVSSTAAKFNEGDRLSYETRTKVPKLDDRTAADTPLVSFSADMTLMDIDFAKSHRERKSGTGTAGVKFGQATTTTSAVFVDSGGRLVERLVSIDKAHPAKREATAKVWVPLKK